MLISHFMIYIYIFIFLLKKTKISSALISKVTLEIAACVSMISMLALCFST